MVEFGSSPGLANLGSFEVSTTSFDFGNLPPGEVYSRVRTRIDAVVSDPSNEASVHYFDFRDYIEAIFLGTGPLTPTNGDHGCSATGWVRGFGSGSTVAVIASDSMSPSQMAAVSERSEPDIPRHRRLHRCLVDGHTGPGPTSRALEKSRSPPIPTHRRRGARMTEAVRSTRL